MKRTKSKRTKAGALRSSRMVRARVWHAKVRLNQLWLDRCEQLLNDAGVPQHVCLVGETVPGNTVPERLKWFLLRRKNVQPWETDNLDNEMKLVEQQARDWMLYGSNDKLTEDAK